MLPFAGDKIGYAEDVAVISHGLQFGEFLVQTVKKLVALNELNAPIDAAELGVPEGYS